MGPTASGKTDLAIALRGQLPVDLINVDSAQVYTGMDIGTAKPDRQTLDLAPHRLISFRDPAQAYSAADFAADAKREMEDIVSAGRIPLLVGGTMLYFKVLLEGLSDLPEADQGIRDAIQRQADRDGWPSVHRELQRVDAVTAESLHPNHSQRIQRALEVYQLTGRPLSELQASTGGGIQEHYDIRQFALIPNNRQLLHKRIESRFYSMMDQGFEAEVEKLYRRGDLQASLPAIRSVGYRQLWDYFEGNCDLSEAIERGIVATRQLSKRQQTWLRNWSNCEQIAVDNDSGYLSTDDLCKLCLKCI
ncbi:MAG: tRNA (adenosine(37)-N6)-dimethylallyltransferase MiaA [Porticoccaceae bacterium]